MPNKAKERKGKKPRKVHPKKLKSTQYKIDGEKVQRKRFCPKCGPGVFLADHKDRFSCGNCSYTEFKQK